MSSRKTATKTPLTKEAIFNNKLKELGLTAKYSESCREQKHYGVTQYRLEIRILRNEQEVEYTTGGFYAKSAYRESAFEQGLRKLDLMNGNKL